MNFYEVLWNIVDETVKAMRESGATEKEIEEFLEAVNCLIQIYETYKSLGVAS